MRDYWPPYASTVAIELLESVEDTDDATAGSVGSVGSVSGEYSVRFTADFEHDPGTDREGGDGGEAGGDMTLVWSLEEFVELAAAMAAPTPGGGAGGGMAGGAGERGGSGTSILSNL
mmetsp:Transcript_1101/g.2389  ORF Transcript_1101/g.2389 Transcript_1101/m.2389 type:complete len:117 (-) Transcript_1101:480-830(-)